MPWCRAPAALRICSAGWCGLVTCCCSFQSALLLGRRALAGCGTACPTADTNNSIRRGCTGTAARFTVPSSACYTDAVWGHLLHSLLCFHMLAGAACICTLQLRAAHRSCPHHTSALPCPASLQAASPAAAQPELGSACRMLALLGPLRGGESAHHTVKLQSLQVRGLIPAWYARIWIILLLQVHLSPGELFPARVLQHPCKLPGAKLPHKAGAAAPPLPPGAGKPSHLPPTPGAPSAHCGRCGRYCRKIDNNDNPHSKPLTQQQGYGKHALPLDALQHCKGRFERQTGPQVHVAGTDRASHAHRTVTCPKQATLSRSTTSLLQHANRGSSLAGMS